MSRRTTRLFSDFWWQGGIFPHYHRAIESHKAIDYIRIEGSLLQHPFTWHVLNSVHVHTYMLHTQATPSSFATTIHLTRPATVRLNTTSYSRFCSPPAIQHNAKQIYSLNITNHYTYITIKQCIPSILEVFLFVHSPRKNKERWRSANEFPSMQRNYSTFP